MVLSNLVKKYIRKSIKRNSYEIIVRYEPNPPLMIFRKESQGNPVPKTICTLAFELQPDGSTKIFDMLEGGEKRESTLRTLLNTLGPMMALYLRYQVSKIRAEDEKLTFEQAFNDIAGASRYNL